MAAISRKPAAPDLEPPLREIVKRILQVTRPERIILFGSRARGRTGPDSDVDILVVARVAHRRRTAQAIYRSLFGLTVPVDVVVATPEDLKRCGGRVGSILRPALKRGRVLYAA